MNPWHLTACENGPTGGGSLGEMMADLVMAASFLVVDQEHTGASPSHSSPPPGCEFGTSSTGTQTKGPWFMEQVTQLTAFDLPLLAPKLCLKMTPIRTWLLRTRWSSSLGAPAVRFGKN